MIKVLKSSEEEAKLTKQEVYDLLREYLKEQIEESYKKMLSDEGFTKASWAAYQAHQLGYLKALNKLLGFLPDKGKTK